MSKTKGKQGYGTSAQQALFDTGIRLAGMYSAYKMGLNTLQAQLNNDMYEPGIRLAGMYSAYKMGLNTLQAQLNNDMYEPGIRLAGMYSAYKMGLVNRLDTLQGELKQLEA